MTKENLTIINLFKDNKIRTIWDEEKQEYYFSVVDVIKALTGSANPRNYWNVLKIRIKEEGSELYTKCVQLKMNALDGKQRLTDTLDTKGILRLIESVPSPNAEPFKLWLANLGKERIDEVFDPEIAIKRAISYYKKRGYTDKWIETRLKSIITRNKLTESWQEYGINKTIEFGILTNEIYKTWSGMKANEYKTYKGLKKESLRDNMTDLELLLTDIGEITTKNLVNKKHPIGLKQNKEIEHKGGTIAKNTKEDIEKALGESIITKENNLTYRYLENKK